MAAGALIVSEAGGVVRFVFISSLYLSSFPHYICLHFLIIFALHFLQSFLFFYYHVCSYLPSQVLDPSGGDFDLMSCDILVCR